MGLCPAPDLGAQGYGHYLQKGGLLMPETAASSLSGAVGRVWTVRGWAACHP